jgi:hypothetical protein
MRKLPVFTGALLWTLLLFVSISAQDFKTVQNGVEYAEFEKSIDKMPVRMNLLRLDLTKVRLDVVHAMDSAIGTEKTSSIAARHGALAAINAGFFRLDTSLFAGDAAGVLVIDNRLISESVNNRIALFIDNFEPNQTIVKFAHLNINESFRIKKKDFHYSGINRERKENEFIKYIPYFHRTTLTDNSGLEVVVKKGKITAINVGKGNSVIPQCYFGKRRNAR